MYLILDVLLNIIVAPFVLAYAYFRETRRRRVAIAGAKAQLQLRNPDSIKALLEAVYGTQDPGDGFLGEMAECLARELARPTAIDPASVHKIVEQCLDRSTLYDPIIPRLNRRSTRVVVRILVEARAGSATT